MHLCYQLVVQHIRINQLSQKCVNQQYYNLASRQSVTRRLNNRLMQVAGLLTYSAFFLVFPVFFNQ